MKKIFEYIRQETAAGHDLVLASIISQEGSSPRDWERRCWWGQKDGFAVL